MIVEVWFECSDSDEFESVIFKQPATLMLQLPRVGDKVGLWQDDFTKGTTAYPLLTVWDVRHYIVSKEGEESGTILWTQEIHVMCSLQ